MQSQSRFERKARWAAARYSGSRGFHRWTADHETTVGRQRIPSWLRVQPYPPVAHPEKSDIDGASNDDRPLVVDGIRL